MLRSTLSLLALVALSACSTYRIRSLEHHGALPVVKLELMRTSGFIFESEEHQFWLCQERDDDLVCRRSCGAGTDLECPTNVYGDQLFVTNTR